MPISRNWVDEEVKGLQGEARAIAKLVDEKRFIRILAWSSFTAARYLANRIAKQSTQQLVTLKNVA